MNGCKPNKANRLRFDKIQEIGCIVCKRQWRLSSPCTWHHIDGQKSQDKHKLTFGLCAAHHTTGGYGMALHAGKARFEELYGTEKELLEYQNQLLGENYA